MVFSGREIARRDQSGAVRVRSDALRCRLQWPALPAADAHTLDIAFSFSLHALDEKAERQMLGETFLSGKAAATSDEIAAHFSQPLRQALAGRLPAHAAQDWIDGEHKSELVELLRSAAKPVAFACGVELLPPFELTIDSPTLQRLKLEQMQREMVERRASGQAEHLQHAAGLLKQFQSLRDAMPGLSPGQLLDRVNPADRGTMLQSLLLASGGESRELLWAVAGPNLVRIDPRTSPARVDLIALPGELGALRSVQAASIGGADRLLIGAQRGVLVVDPDHPQQAVRYVDPETTSALGFNSAVAAGDMIYATHAEAGVVGWRMGEAEAPAVVHRTAAGPIGQSSGKAPSPARLNTIQTTSSVSIRETSAPVPGPRNLAALENDRILYSVGGQVFMMKRDGDTSPVGASSAGVVLIVPEGQRIAVVRDDGVVEWLDRQTLESVAVSRQSGNISAAATLPWLGTMRLLLASEAGPVCCIGADDSLTTQYASTHRGLRAICATGDLIAGISPDRQRIILWKTWEGRQPADEIHLAARARHRIADVAFGLNE